MKPAYGICPNCNYERALRKSGTLRQHQFMTPRGYLTSTICAGTDQPPIRITRPAKPKPV